MIGAVFGVAFVALAIWLAVRIINRHERWAIWTAVAVGLPVFYSLSIGPAAWAMSNGLMPESTYDVIYEPIWWLCEKSDVLGEACFNYVISWTGKV